MSLWLNPLELAFQILAAKSTLPGMVSIMTCILFRRGEVICSSSDNKEKEELGSEPGLFVVKAYLNNKAITG